METTSLTFGSPLWFWALAALPILALLFLWAQLQSRRLVTKIVAPRLRDQLAGSVSYFRRTLRAVLVLASLALVILALAQPRRGFIETETKSRGRDVVVAIDTSRSMLATDVPPTRLARAKLVTQDLVRLLKGDRVGLVAFAGSAFLQAPLTLDYSAVVNSLDELDTSVIPKGGTNIGAAIATAQEAFGKAEGQTRALVILTDGEELDADGVAAAKKASESGVRIFTIGIGSPEGSLIPIRTDEGRTDFVRDVMGKPVQSKLDETRLKEIAEVTGGFYVPIGPDAAREIFQRGIEPMDQSETGVMSSRQPLEQYQWPLGAAIALLILWMLVGERRKRATKFAPAGVVLALLALPSLGRADTTGLADYQSGNFEKARQNFEQRLKNDPDSRKLQFNAGASAYKLGDFDQAINHFTSALLAEDKKLREDAAYNLANALVRRGEAAKEPDKKKTDWKSAIEHYTDALNLDPKNKPAEENREIVKKLLEDLEKQQQQQQDQNKDDQKKDDQKNQDQNKDQKDQKDQQNKDQKDQQNKDQQQQDQKNDQQKQDQKDQQQKDSQKDQKDQKDNQNKDSQSGNKPEDKKDNPQDQKKPDSQKDGDKDQQKPQQPGKDQQQPAAPTPTPGEKKQGDLKAGNDKDAKQEEKPQPAAPAEAGEEEGKEGEMSAAQARGLLNSLRSEEEKVNLMPQQTSEDVLRDW